MNIIPYVQTDINRSHVLVENEMKAICHKARARNYVFTCIASSVLMVLSSQASAACSRDDVTFYLEKGFTAEQITVLCSEPSKPAADAQQIDSENNEHQSALTLGGNALYLNRAIKAHKINLSSDSLQYTLKTCVNYGEYDDYGFAPKVCPDVTYTIALKDLEVLSTGMKYGFYGTQEAHVKSSEIQREIIGELQDQKAEDRGRILDAFEKGNETVIPVRDDFSLDEVKRVLEELSQ